MTGTIVAQSVDRRKLVIEKSSQLVDRYWFKAIMLILAAHIILNKDISIEFNLNSAMAASLPSNTVDGRGAGTHPVDHFELIPQSKQDDYKKAAGKYRNLTFILNPGYANKKGIAPQIVQVKNRICNAYIERYARLAREEMNTYGIPASITLAQGLLESDAGESRLALESNNHFGIKCRRKCRGCTCRNYADDDIYDMFRVFNTPRESFREHSKLLNSKRYRHLLKLTRTDYHNWAHGLKKAGYATDKRYAHKLIRIIEQLELHRFDRQA